MMASTSCRTWSVGAAWALLLVLGVAVTAHAAPFAFAPPAPSATGLSPVATAVADLDGDGLPDLVTVNVEGDTLSVLRSNVSAPGTFRPAVNYPVPEFPVGVGIADLNLDGTLDLVVISCGCDGPLTILLGNATAKGTFLAHQPYLLASEPYALAIADLNGDGLPDLAISSDFDDNVTILLNDSTAPGTFLAAVSYLVGNQPGRLAVGDFNNDGVPDLAISVTASDFSPDAVAILLGNATARGTFLAAVLYLTGATPDSVVVGDFNRDGVLDLAVGTTTAGATISVLLGNVGAPGTFGAYVEYPAGASESGLAVGDLNGDGRLELVVADGISNLIRVLRGRGDGTFLSPVAFAVGSLPVSPVIADLNGDGRPDIATATVISDRVSVLLNTTPFVPRIRFSQAAYFAVRESVSPRIITVLRNGGLGVSATVQYAASDGSATEAGGDYVATAGTLTFGPMETSKTFELPIVADGITENAETINLALSNPGGGAALGTPSTAVATIAANDIPYLQFSRAAYVSVERTQLVTIMVTRRHGFGTPVTVDYATTPGGTATAGQDYIATSGTLSFGPNDDRMTFQVQILDDALTEGPQTINLALSNQSVGAAIGPRVTAVLTILAND